MTRLDAPGPAEAATAWLADPGHRSWLASDARRQLGFFRQSLRGDGGFDVLAQDCTPLPRGAQELHTTTRLVHSYALGQAWGEPDCDRIIEAGMDFLWRHHRDARHGGYAWAVAGAAPQGAGAVGDSTKLAYGHVFVLLAATSARAIGHPDADRLIADIAEIIDRRFWDESRGLLREEFAADWTPFSSYRGMNANMHGVEAFLGAYEATGETLWRDRAGRILDFFVGRMAPEHGWRIPEHYHADWSVDPDYRGNPMFRPQGTTPGHSLELGRLVIQHWDLCGRPDDGAPDRARRLVTQALADAWLTDGGLAYTLDASGKVAVRDRYWWPVTEAIGAMAALLKTAPAPGDEDWYRRLWRFADARLIDHDAGGWYPELDEEGRPAERQFRGKPDLYHALQAALFPLVPEVSRLVTALARSRGD